MDVAEKEGGLRRLMGMSGFGAGMAGAGRSPTGVIEHGAPADFIGEPCGGGGVKVGGGEH